MLFRTKLVVISVIAASFCLSLTVTSQTKVPLSHEAMWMMKRVGAPNPSPDGKWIVFSLIEPAYDEKDQVSDLWIVANEGSAKPRRLTSSKGGESGVAWSPDSRQIAFSAKREGDEVNQIYVLDVAGGGEAVPVTHLRLRFLFQNLDQRANFSESDDCGGCLSHVLAHPSCATLRSDIRPLGVDPLASAWLWRSVSVDSCARMVSQSGALQFSWWLRVFSQ